MLLFLCVRAGGIHSKKPFVMMQDTDCHVQYSTVVPVVMTHVTLDTGVMYSTAEPVVMTCHT